MRLHRNAGEVFDVSDIISDLGQELLLKFKFTRGSQRAGRLGSDYGLGEIIKSCLEGDSAASPAKELCETLAKSFANYDISSMDYGYVLEALSVKQPRAFLDGFLGEDIEFNPRIARAFSEDIGKDKHPLARIEDDIVLEWCELNPDTRYPSVAAAMQPYQADGQDGELEWTPLAQSIISNSSDPVLVLNEFKAALRPTSWSGSRAEIMQKRLPLITSLINHDKPLVAEWAAREEVKFSKEISSERKLELERDTARDERFEYE